ncbi:MAG: outer membrane beta-barrel protein, partial [Gemmatimonadetes bacterium]|nr:outer membrane beta-barrel protein [Gemmatimonadota bacterium]
MSARRMVRSWRRGVLACGAVLALGAMAAPLQAQEEYEVRGVVTDSAGAPLRNAMVVALTQTDSVLTKYALTNGDGRFVMSDLSAGQYILQVTLIGFELFRRDFEISDADIDAGTVEMAVTAVELDSLVVSVEHVPFINRGDTLSYNVLAFPTQPNAMVEDLLKRLPGIEVDTEGNIKAQGEEVENVLVDGREFFGKDPKVATRNLPADAVKQVDVYDKQSDMAEFTGIPDGDDERTIDLKLREEARRGYFGQASGGFGGDMNTEARLGALARNELRYDGRFTLNRFSPTMQMSVNANTNNTNRSGFSMDGYGELMAMGGGGFVVEEMLAREGFGGGGGGFGDSRGAGLNLSRDFGEKGWIRGSYSLSDSDNRQDRVLQQQAVFGANVASQIADSSQQESGNTGHRLNLNGQYAFSPGHQVRVRVNANTRSSTMDSFQQRVTRTVDGQPLNTAVTNYDVNGSNWSGNAQVTWRKRLGEGGRAVVAEFNSDLQGSDQVADLGSTITGESRGGTVAGAGATEDIRQEQSNTGGSWNNSARISFTQPMGERYVMEVYGRGRARSQDQDREVFDIVSDGLIRNDELTSGFERTYNYYNAGGRFSRNGEKAWITLGLNAQRSDLSGTIVDRDETISNGYTHLLGNVDLKWEVKDGQYFGFRYGTSTREPSLNQLQPFVDNRDPINVYVGNPDLRPSYSHSVSSEYRFFDQFSFINLFTRAGFSYTRDPIANSRVFDDQGFQTVSPINTDASWSVNGNTSFGTPIRKLGVDIDLSYGISYSEGIEVINSASNESRVIRNTVGARLSNRNKERFEIGAGANFTFNDVEYSLNQALNRDYVNSRYSANGRIYLGSWTLGSTFSWNVYDQNLYNIGAGRGGESYTPSPGRNVARWDARASRRVLSDRAEVQIQAFDLLNQSQAVNISNSGSFIQESRTQSLGQYFMVRVMYRLGMRGFG